MDGVAAVRSVLVADAAILGLLPDYTVDGKTKTRIVAGPAPLGTQLPALMLESISKTDRNILAPGSQRHVRERVQVTVMARNYPEQKVILRAVRHAAADRLNPAVAGLVGVTIHTETAGPDFMAEDASVWLGSQDFMITFLEIR